MAHSPLLFVLAGAFVAYVLYTRITLYLARRQFKKDNGALEEKSYCVTLTIDRLPTMHGCL
jgi:hypothetical protein